MESAPITNVPAEQRAKDEQQIRLLATFHYVLAAVGGLFACFPLIHVAIGILFLTAPESFANGKGPPPPGWLGILFIVVGSVFVMIGWAMAICTLISGRYLARHQKRMFSFVVAAVLCAFMPFGTVLGIFTIVVLSKDSVKLLYEERA